MNRKQRRRQAQAQRRRTAAPTLDPAVNAGTVEATLATAMQYHQAGKLQQAEALYRRVLEAQPNHHVALHFLGLAAHQAGKSDMAVELIGRAIALMPDYAEAHYNLGNMLYEQGKLEEAVASYRKVVALRPNAEEAHCNLGNALADLGKLDEAVACYRKAVALRPDHAAAYSNLGNALNDQGEFEGAVAACRKAIALDSNLAEAHCNLGVALKGQGKLEEAVASYRRAIALKPHYAEAHTNLGNALQKLGRFDEATAADRKAIVIKPDIAEAHYNLGIALIRQGKLNEAAASFLRAIEIEPDDLNAHYQYALIHKFFPGDPKIEMLQTFLKREDITETDRINLSFALGNAHDQIRRYSEAFSYFAAANKYYAAANAEAAQRMDLDADGRREQIREIKNVFRERRDTPGRGSGEMERVPIFVVGVSRSGKTLVESLLSQHEDVFAARESPEWANAMKVVLDKYSVPELYPKFTTLLSDHQIKEMGLLYLANLLKNSADSKVTIDTMPANYQYIGLILQAFPAGRVIYCHRDPIDVCLRLYFKRKWRLQNLNDFDSIASYWYDYQDLMAHWQRLYGDRILSVRYEDLVRSPADIGARIFGFCGLDYDPTVIRHAFTTDEIGHWKHYEPYLQPLRQALAGLTQQSNGGVATRHRHAVHR